MSSNKFFVKDCLQDIHWFGHSVMKPVDYAEFQKREATIEGDDDHSETNQMEIIAEGVMYKALMVIGKTTYTKQPWNTIHEVIHDE